MAKQRKVTEREVKQPNIGKEKESDGSVPAATVWKVMQNQQWLMIIEQEQEDWWDIMMK